MLVKTVNEIVKEMEVLEKNLMGMFSLSDLAGADDEMLKMFKSYGKLMELSKEYAIEQAKAIDDMNEKLDKIDKNLYEVLLNTK